MEIARRHWSILQELDNEFADRVREFLVFGNEGDAALLVTEDGQAYWFGMLKFEKESHDVQEPTPLNVSNVASMAHGHTHILLRKSSGKLYALGTNEYGQLGRGTYDHLNPFTARPIITSHKFETIRCGYKFSVGLNSDGKVWTWGSNCYGELGLPSDLTFSKSSLRQIIELDPYRVLAIACGGSHSLALTEQGKVYGWGRNDAGQLGNANGKDMPIPIPLITGRPNIQIAAGSNHTLLLTDNGEVWGCGRNRCGQLAMPVSVEFGVSLTKVQGLPPISHIASHFDTRLSIAFTAQRECYVWGKLGDRTRNPIPLRLPPIYSTVDLALSYVSAYKSTPYSVQVPVRNESNTTCTRPLMAQMFDNANASPDVHFLVEEQSIFAHRSVLQMHSGHLNRLLSSASADHLNTSATNSEPAVPSTVQVTIPITGHSYLIYRTYINFFYTNKIQNILPDHLPSLFELALSYFETEIQDLCLSRMAKSLSVENCCLYYQLTNRHSLPLLQHQIVQFISDKFMQVILSPGYQSMNGDICKKLATSIANLR